MSRTDLILNPCGDLRVEDGDFVIVRDADQIRQSWLIRVRTFRGEWLLDTGLGLPYFQEIFEKNVSRRYIEQLFIDMTLATPGVISVQSCLLEALDIGSRTFSLTIEAMIEGPEHATFRYDGTLAPGDCPLQPDQEFPLTIPGLHIWFDAQDLSALQWDGSHLSMSNKAGTGLAVGTGLSGEPALQGASPINGHRAVRFDNAAGEEQYLFFDDTPAMNAHTGLTIFVVQRHGSSSGPSLEQALLCLLGIDPALSEVEDLAFLYGIDGLGSSFLRLLSRQFSGPAGDAETLPMGLENQPEISVAQTDGAGGLPNMRRNQFLQSVVGTSAERDLDGSGAIGCSIFGDAATALFHGHIGEVLVYDRQLSDTEIDSVVWWLRQKWSFTFDVDGAEGFGHGPFGQVPFGQ